MRDIRLLKGKVGIILPTCNPDVVFKDLLPSVKYISELSDIATFLINFNGPEWDSIKIEECVRQLNDFGFVVKWDHTGIWDRPIKLIMMRELTAALEPNCDLYLFVDDDFRFVEKTAKYPFSSGERYLHSIDYIMRFPKCGVLNTKSFLGGAHQKLKIINTKDDMVATNRGLFLRNMIDHGFFLAPEDTWDIPGGLEETLMSMCRVERGYWCGKQMTNPTVHITGKLSDYDNKPENFHNISLIDNNIGDYLRRRYDDWEWMYEEKRWPKKLWEMYAKNGGLDMKPADPKYTVDYAELYPNW